MMSFELNRRRIIAALDDEIARFQQARTLIARSATEHPVHLPATPPIASIPPKKHRLSAAARERIAEAQRKRWAEKKKLAPVLITRVPAKERPVHRVPKTLRRLSTSLTGDVPRGPVAVPAKG
jgi:hypothetical protein